MAEHRQERDLLGPRDVPAGALYGICTARAVENFPLTRRPVHPELIHAYGAVKLACARTNHELGRWDDLAFAAIERACAEMMEGKLDPHVVVDALQGGAGTSTNMNVNEVLANRALQLLGRPLGEYDTIDPLDDINLHQSTNDTYPTALKLAAVRLLGRLERSVQALGESFGRKAKQFAHVVKLGRTHLQDAVLTTLGGELGAYGAAFARDCERIGPCQRRLRVVNLGGTAIGTSLGAPRQFVLRAVEHLREITALGLARAEDLVEATQNADAFVEVSGAMKALASNLLKVSADLRLLSSGPEGGLGEIRLPPCQAGSSIMPGKVNPVIPEAVALAAMAVIGHDQAITLACSMGCLELNVFLPLVADALLGGLGMLAAACELFAARCVEGIEADEARCRAQVDGSTAALTALVEAIGYEKASGIADAAKRQGLTIRQAVIQSGLLTEQQFRDLTDPGNVLRLGCPPETSRDGRR